MKELINKITANAGITEAQAMKALDSVKDYVKEQFPMMAGAVDKLFEGQGGETQTDDYV